MVFWQAVVSWWSFVTRDPAIFFRNAVRTLSASETLKVLLASNGWIDACAAGTSPMRIRPEETTSYVRALARRGAMTVMKDFNSTYAPGSRSETIGCSSVRCCLFFTATSTSFTSSTVLPSPHENSSVLCIDQAAQNPLPYFFSYSQSSVNATPTSS